MDVVLALGSEIIRAVGGSSAQALVGDITGIVRLWFLASSPSSHFPTYL